MDYGGLGKEDSGCLLKKSLKGRRIRMTKKKAVVVIRDPKIILMMSDPIRKEIHRLLSKKFMTEKELSALLGITKASVGYHLRLLKDAGIIRIQRTSIEQHGILQKFCETSSVHFVVDYERVPLMVRKHYLDVHMERLRGILSLLQAVRREKGRHISINSDIVEELAEDIAKSIVAVGVEHEGQETDLDRETYLTILYGEALTRIFSSEKWREFFKEAGQLGEFTLTECSCVYDMVFRLLLV
jgi:DNA-binding transcriptional ArsR family regulator